MKGKESYRDNVFHNGLFVGGMKITRTGTLHDFRNLKSELQECGGKHLETKTSTRNIFIDRIASNLTILLMPFNYVQFWYFREFFSFRGFCYEILPSTILLFGV